MGRKPCSDSSASQWLHRVEPKSVTSTEGFRLVMGLPQLSSDFRIFHPQKTMQQGSPIYGPPNYQNSIKVARKGPPQLKNQVRGRTASAEKKTSRRRKPQRTVGTCWKMKNRWTTLDELAAVSFFGDWTPKLFGKNQVVIRWVFYISKRCLSVSLYRTKKGEKAEKVKAPKKGSVPQHPRPRRKEWFSLWFSPRLFKEKPKKQETKANQDGCFCLTYQSKTTSFSLLSLSLVTSSFSWHLLAHQQEWLNGFKGRNTANQRYPALLASNRGCQPIQGCTTLMDFPRKKTIGNCWTTKSWFVAALAVGGCCLKIWTPKAIWRF